ncbi:ABC transporter permease [Amorphoplanes digitatis]|uniref:Transport permease protein n=1 Tax=Actinoplanes digitatis TaxID=1868 RepID=A0A7W7I5J3_9ACTN|nr:ABC transporter permease [Actinoplanes digitatis]MBB4766855.1 teichoic acid transport system permease protein [Actinoplanes digitatis]BFE77057.1 ABC transporter permease [Actinoplanes digitatis]GID97711.1 transport permease protein [Actinoplanes digitatis]
MPPTAVADSDTGLALKELARTHGLSAAGKLPSLRDYSRQLWSYRHFIASYANAKVSSSLGRTKLGAFWQVLTPLINAAVYYVIFGVLLNTQRGVDNFVAYLCIGVFVFGFTQSVVQSGIQSISSNMGLIRALHFPRASLPLAITMVEIRNMFASMAVLMVIVLAFGEPITWEWLLIIPAFVLQSIFNAGLAMGTARLGSKVADFKQLVPFIMRIWLYGSAVLYPVTQFSDHLSGWKLYLVEANPLLIFIELMRHALMEDVTLAASAPVLWLQAIGWTALVGLGGYVYFWRGEKGYGRG